MKKNGVLYYSVCSILQQETIDICNKFLNKNKKVELMEITKIPKQLKKNIISYKKTITILPEYDNNDGFLCRFVESAF